VVRLRWFRVELVLLYGKDVENIYGENTATVIEVHMYYVLQYEMNASDATL